MAEIVSEPLDEHTNWTRDQKLERVYELMDQVGLNRAFANRIARCLSVLACTSRRSTSSKKSV